MSDDEFDSDAHHKLMRNVARSIRGQPPILAVGTTSTQESTDGAHVQLDDLVATIQSSSDINELKKQLVYRHNKLLDAPIHRQQRQRIHREVAYDLTKKQLNKWSGVIGANRLADQLTFPLDREPFRLKSTAERVASFTPRTALELAMDKVLGTSKHNLRNDDPYTDAEKELIRAMSLKEAKEKCHEMQRMRSLMSFKEAKYNRQKKIKSKKYHRILKRQKHKQLIKEFDELATRNPQAASDKLNQLEHDRIMERATLKHRTANKWTKQLELHASRDRSAREMLDDRHRLSRELTQKHGIPVDDDDDDDKNEETTVDTVIKRIDSRHMLQEIADQQTMRSKQKQTTTPSDDEPTMTNVNHILRATIDNNRSIVQIAPELVVRIDEDVHDDQHADEQAALLAQAFEDDDVIADFEAEKRAVEQAEQPKDIDLCLPGWGEWTGPGMSISRKKKDRFVIKAKPIKRKDRNKPGVIIRETPDESIRKLQVSRVPYPFTSMDDLEAMVRQPIGKEWNSDSVHRSLIESNIVTSAGAIIAPMNKQTTLRDQFVEEEEEEDDDDD